MLELIQKEFIQSFRDVAGGVADTIPDLLAAFVFIVLGAIFGSAFGKVVTQMVSAMKADEWLAKVGVDRVLSRAGYHLDTSYFFGWLAKAFVFLVFLIAALDIVGLTQVNVFLGEVLRYIPQVVIASVILFVASIASDFMSNLISGTTRAAGSRVSALLGTMARWAIWMFAIIMALSQLGVAPQYMYTLFAGFVAMLALAGGLAFGLGGKDAAQQFIKDVQKEVGQK
jgi:hypothetical protein